jgi:hypothetical protein
MKWDYRNWMILALVAAAALFFYEWRCDNKPAQTQSSLQQNTDSVVAAVARHQADSLYIDSLKTDDSIHRRMTVAQNARINLLNDTLDKIKASVFKLRRTVLAPDTVGLIDPGCAGMSDAFDKYILVSEEKGRTQDSTIAIQQQIISNQDSITRAKDEFNAQLSRAFSQVTANFQDLSKLSTSQDKTLKWSKIKEKGLIAVVLLEGGKILFDSLKK